MQAWKNNALEHMPLPSNATVGIMIFTVTDYNSIDRHMLVAAPLWGQTATGVIWAFGLWVAAKLMKSLSEATELRADEKEANDHVMQT